MNIEEAEFVTTTGTNHDRMQLIRPQFFLLKTYFKIWQQHPDTKVSRNENCTRISLTTIRATQHITKNSNPAETSTEKRTFGEHTLYCNTKQDPYEWNEADIRRISKEISEKDPYHLYCDAFYFAHLIKKLKYYNLWESFPKPKTIIHAYELCTKNIKRYIEDAINSPIVNLFGSTELGYMFSTGSDGKMKPHLEKMEIELIPAAEGSSILSLIVTSTRNPYMPLIRYRSGDCVQTKDGSLKVENIYRVCGREKELYYAENTTPIAHAMLDDIISNISHNIFIYQLHIQSETEARFDYCTFNDESLNPQEVSELKLRLDNLLNINCGFFYKNNIPPIGPGKYTWITKYN